MSTFLRILIALAALAVAAVHLAVPDIKVDITFFALIAVALLAIFARGIRIKALDLMGVKVEFDKQEEKPETVSVPLQNETRLAPLETQRYPLPAADSYSTRLLKLTPIETLTPYVIVMSLIGNYRGSISTDKAFILLWSIFGLFFLITPVYYYYQLVSTKPADRLTFWQVCMMSLMFLGWAFALGGPFTSFAWYNSTYGALVLTAIAFAVPVSVR
jgi:hypothetical protein